MSDSLNPDCAADRAFLQRLFADGGIFAYPSDTLWGIGGNPADARAVAAVCRLKGERRGKGLIIVAADWAQCEDWAQLPDENARREMEALHRASPTTFILPAKEKAACALTLHGNIALRLSAHPQVRALCRLFASPLISTSVNPTGMPPAVDAAAVRAYFPDLPLLAGESGDPRRPSRIYDWVKKTFIRGAA